MYKITKDFHFAASHQLANLPDGHKCKRLHGHNFIVQIELSSRKLNEFGFVVDFGQLYPVKNYIDEVLDHHHLNDIIGDNATAENLAKHLFNFCYGIWPESITAVCVSETPKTWAMYDGGA